MAEEEASSHIAAARDREDARRRENSAQGLGSFSVLLQDCLDTLLIFVSLHDCLNLSRTSLTFMEEINRSDLKRRKKRLQEPHAYRTLSSGGYELFPVNDSSFLSTQDISVLPSVRDRIEALSNALPASESHKQKSLRLFHEINRPDDMVLTLGSLGTKGISDRFRRSFQIQQTLLRPHRLHARLLSLAIAGDPRQWRIGHKPSGIRDLTSELDSYMSDVLCAAYLMGHSQAGLVEGGPSESAWMDKIMSLQRERTELVPCYCFYSAWVYLHSTLLRTSPFTLDQRQQLGISSSHLQRSIANQSLIVTDEFAPFVSRDHVKRAQVWDCLDNLGTLSTRLNDFGRLGPTFRGRDLIQSRKIQATDCTGVMRAFNDLKGDYSAASPFLRSWCDEEAPVVAWLLFMNREAGKARPMTVSPPTVSVRASPSDT